MGSLASSKSTFRLVVPASNWPLSLTEHNIIKRQAGQCSAVQQGMVMAMTVAASQCIVHFSSVLGEAAKSETKA